MGAIVGKLATFLLAPVIARLYTPENFSEFALFASMLVAISPLLTMRYSQALIVPRSDAALVNLAALCVIIGATITVLSGASMIFYVLFAETGGRTFAFLVPLAVVIVAPALVFSEILCCLAIRDRKYALLARTQASQAIVGSVAKVGFGLVGAAGLGLIIGHIMGQFAGIRLLIRVHWSWWLASRYKVKWRNIKVVAGTFWQFPAYRLPSQMLLVLATQGPIIFVVWQYSANQSGQFALAISIVTAAVNIVGTSIARAFLGEAGEIYRHQRPRLVRYTIKMQALFVAIFAPLAFLIYFFAQPLLWLLLGPNWELAAELAPVLIIYGVAQIASAPVIQIFTFMKLQTMFLFINSVRLSVVGGLFLVARFSSMDIRDFTSNYTMLMVVFYVFVAVLVLNFLAVELRASARHRS
jgi:O-antigen/teichoic acid export membrane protein